MPLLLIRHAEALDPRRWNGPDRQRPLTPEGERSALALADQWRTQALTRILSSPYPRCIDTMTPMADERRLPVEATEDLAEGNAAAALRLLERVADQFVAACSHGDVIPAVLSSLEGQGIPVESPLRWDNASTWRLETEGLWIVAATYVPPPISMPA